MFDRLKQLFWKHVVAEVPDEMAACIDCNRIDCREGEYRVCPNRLTRVAALQTLRSGPDQDEKSAP